MERKEIRQLYRRFPIRWQEQDFTNMLQIKLQREQRKEEINSC